MTSDEAKYNFTAADRQEAIARYYDQEVPPLVLFVTFFVIGLPGNLLVLLVQWKEKTMTITKLFIFAIAIIDLLSILIAYPLNVVYHLYWLSISNVSFCKFSWAVNILSSMPALLLIFGLSVVRYYRVCRGHKLYLIEKNVKYFFLLVFLLTLIFTVLAIIMKGEQKRPDEDLSLGLPGFQCDTSDYYRDSVEYKISISLVAGIFIFCITFIIILNCLILRRVLKQRKLLSSYSYCVVVKPRGVLKLVNNPANKVERNSDKHSNDTIKDRDGVPGSQQSDESRVTSQNSKKQLSSVHSPNTNTNTEEDIISSITFEKENDNMVAWSVNSSEKSSHKSEHRRHNSNNDINDIGTVIKTIQNAQENERGFKRKSTCKCCKCRCRCWRCCRHCRCCKSCFKSLRGTNVKVFTVNAIYLSAYIPFFVYDILENTGARRSRLLWHDLYKYAVNPLSILPLLRCALNPLIYYLLDPSFRHKCRSLCKKRRKKPHT